MEPWKLDSKRLIKVSFSRDVHLHSNHGWMIQNQDAQYLLSWVKEKMSGDLNISSVNSRLGNTPRSVPNKNSKTGV